MPKLKKVGTLAIAVMLAQLILTKGLYPLIGKNTQQLFSINPVSGIGGLQVGDTVIGYLSGHVPFEVFNLGVLISMYIGTFALIWAGFWLYEQKHVKLWKGKNLTQRLIFILLYGHAVLYAVLYLFKHDVSGIGLNLLIGLSLNLLFVAALVTASSKYFKWPRV